MNGVYCVDSIIMQDSFHEYLLEIMVLNTIDIDYHDFISRAYWHQLCTVKN